MIYVYVRVSTEKQDAETQLQGVAEYLKRVFNVDINDEERVKIVKEVGVSGKLRSDERGGLKKLLEEIEEGDILIVAELSRLGRNVADVIKTLDELVNKKKVRVISVKENLDSAADKLYFKIFSTIVSLFADLEREFISMRTKEGLARARAEGKQIGRPRKLAEEQEREIIEKYKKGYAVKDLAKLFNVSERTIRRVLARHRVVKIVEYK